MLAKMLTPRRFLDHEHAHQLLAGPRTRSARTRSQSIGQARLDQTGFISTTAYQAPMSSRV